MESQCHGRACRATCPYSLSFEQDGTSSPTLEWERFWLILVSVLSQENNSPASKFPSQRLIGVFVNPAAGLLSSSLACPQGGEIIKFLLPLTWKHPEESCPHEKQQASTCSSVSHGLFLKGLTFPGHHFYIQLSPHHIPQHLQSSSVATGCQL